MRVSLRSCLYIRVFRCAKLVAIDIVTPEGVLTTKLVFSTYYLCGQFVMTLMFVSLLTLSPPLRGEADIKVREGSTGKRPHHQRGKAQEQHLQISTSYVIDRALNSHFREQRVCDQFTTLYFTTIINDSHTPRTTK